MGLVLRLQRGEGAFAKARGNRRIDPFLPDCSLFGSQGERRVEFRSCIPGALDAQQAKSEVVPAFEVTRIEFDQMLKNGCRRRRVALAGEKPGAQPAAAAAGSPP